MVGASRLQEETGRVGRLSLGGFEIRRILPGVDNGNRRDALATDERVEMQQPFFAERSDVDVNTVQRTERADRIGAILQHPGRPYRTRPLVELRYRTILVR